MTRFPPYGIAPALRRTVTLLLFVIGAAGIASCSPLALSLQAMPLSGPGLHEQATPHTPTPVAVASSDPTTEARVEVIRLSGPAGNRRAEISGMAWFDEMLILLPQWPEFQEDGSSVLFALPKVQIESLLDGGSRGPIEPMTLHLDDAAVRDALPTFGGYEAIAFVGDQVYLTIESWAPYGSDGYLVRGSVDRDNATVWLDASTLSLIPPQTGKPNVSDESIVIAGDSLLTIYELNGALVNNAPIAHRFTLEGQPIEPVPFPAIEYRITDATPVDEDGRFWGFNFYFPAEGVAVVEPEPLASVFGQGASHANRIQVERLVEFVWDGTQVKLSDRAPIQLRLALLARNWEGIARLDDRGFLIVTDKYPTTVLAFVAAP